MRRTRALHLHYPHPPIVRGEHMHHGTNGSTRYAFSAFFAALILASASDACASRSPSPERNAPTPITDPHQIGVGVPGRKLAEGLYQLTGMHLRPGQTQHELAELPDPAP